jgi:ribosomal protein S18 acetylase RimI-like enzyme
VELRPATSDEAAVLSALAMQAKAHWGYPAEALERWRTELAVSPTAVRERPTVVAEVGSKVVGFYSLRPSGESWELFDLWVLPGFMRQGVGRALLSHALAIAARAGVTKVTVDADPNAESFYLQNGAIRFGEVPAPIPGQPGRVRPQLAFRISADT